MSSIVAKDQESSDVPPGVLSYRGVYRKATVPPCQLSHEALIRLFEELEEKGREGLEHHLAGVQTPDEGDPNEFEQLKVRARESYRLAMMIIGDRGEQVAVSSLESLRSQRLPDRVLEVVYDSGANLKNLFNFEPNNRFRVSLDFSEPPGFDEYDPSNKQTPNASMFEVIGPNTTWVTGVYEYLMGFFRNRGTKREWLHSHGNYNIYQWVFAIPASLWVVYRIAEAFETFFGNLHGALTGAIYIYLFLLIFLIARGMVLGLRWMFPLVELSGSRSRRARVLVGTVVGGLVLGLLSDVVWTVLTW